jgi:hypothetical protein
MPKIHPVARPKIQTKLHDTLAHCLAIAEVAKTYPIKSDANPSTPLYIPQGMKPFSEGVMPRLCQIFTEFPLFH